MATKKCSKAAVAKQAQADKRYRQQHPDRVRAKRANYTATLKTDIVRD
jgi:hypothetical protein